MPYITKSKIEQYMGITIDASLQSFIDTLVAMAEEYIETYCGGGEVERRIFNLDAEAEPTTRYYDGKGTSKLKIDDLLEITSITADGVALTLNEDYYLYPLNALADGKPYEWIELLQPESKLNGSVNSRLDSSVPFIFEKKQKNVAITGKFGYSNTPPEVVVVSALRIVKTIIMENIGSADLKNLTAESIGDYSVTYQSVKDAAVSNKVGELLDLFVVRKSNAKKTGVFIAR